MGRLAGLCLLPLALTAVGCASRRAPALVLPPPAPATTTTTPAITTARRSNTTSARRTTTTTARPTVATATTAPLAGPVAPAPARPTTTAARSTGRVGAPRPAAPATDAPSATTAAPTGTVVVPRVTGGPVTPQGGPLSPTTTDPLPLPAPAPAPALQVTAPSGRAVPEGPFDVIVTGSTGHQLLAEPASVCAADAGRVVPVGAGECRVRATAAGFRDAEAVVRIRRGDQAITWQLGATTPFTYNTLALDLRATSGRPVQATAARGSCKLAGPAALSFVVVGNGGMPQLGQCEVTAAVAETAEWNGATITLVTTTTRSPVTLALDVPATAALPSFTAKVTMTQADRSLDNLLSFSVESSGACSLSASAGLVNSSTRTATLRVSGSAPASGWCAVRVLTDVGGAAGLVSFTTPGCRFVWIGTGTAPSTKPACPW